MSDQSKPTISPIYALYFAMMWEQVKGMKNSPEFLAKIDADWERAFNRDIIGR